MTELKEKNILFELLRKFSPEEWKEFEKFAVSPFFNNGRNYETLMKIFRKHFPAFDSPELSKRKIYAKLFSGKKYKESVMYSIFSRLYAIAEEFLVYKEIQKDRFISREKYKLAGYRTKEINSRAKKIISGLDKKFRENVKSNYDFYHQKEFCKELAYYYYTINRRDKISKPVLNSQMSRKAKNRM